MGLAGVFRVSENGPNQPPVALKGHWATENEFALIFREVAGVNHFEFRIVFDGEKNK